MYYTHCSAQRRNSSSSQKEGPPPPLAPLQQAATAGKRRAGRSADTSRYYRERGAATAALLTGYRVVAAAQAMAEPEAVGKVDTHECSSSEATVTILGYASLMDEASARATTPNLSGWNYGTVHGFCRIFNLVSIVNVRRGLATGRHLATCTARRRKGCSLRVCCYEVPKSEYSGLLARERRLRAETVEYIADGNSTETKMATMFTEYSDEEYRAERATTPELWHEEVGQYYAGAKIYRDDLLPVPSYLEKCVTAYTALGSLDNFLDNSFLGDGTSIRSYLAEQPQL